MPCNFLPWFSDFCTLLLVAWHSIFLSDPLKTNLLTVVFAWTLWKTFTPRSSTFSHLFEVWWFFSLPKSAEWMNSFQPNKIHPFLSPFLGFGPIVAVKWQFVKGNTFFEIPSSLLRPAATHLFGILRSKTRGLSVVNRNQPSCRSPFYVIANTSPIPPITQTWTRMAAILVQFFKLQKFLRNRRFEQIKKFFHYCTTEIEKNHSVIKTKLGLGAL